MSERCANCSKPLFFGAQGGTVNGKELCTLKCRDEYKFPDPKQNMAESGLHMARLKLKRLRNEIDGILERTNSPE